MLPIGSHERSFEVPGFVGECLNCGNQTLRDAEARYAYGTYAGVFGLLKSVEIYGICPRCEDEVKVPEAEVPDDVRAQIPFMHRKGILVLAAVIGIAVLLLVFGVAVS